MLFIYKALDKEGNKREGSIDAINIDVAITSLQRRGLIISSINPQDEQKSIFDRDFKLFSHISNKDVVILSRQISTLFSAQVSALRAFRLLALETANAALRDRLKEVADDVQGGSPIYKAMSKHPKVFSDFYVNMVKAGEESGKLDETFNYLADYLDRNYEVTSKARNALIYPSFVVFTFCAVMVLMLTAIIPKISIILKESGQELPIYTKIVIGLSDFLVNYGIFFLIALIIAGFLTWKWSKTPDGALFFADFKLHVPYVGNLYRKLYLSRIADNLTTMLLSAIPIIKALEITADVVGNKVFKNVITETAEDVRGGITLSDALGKHPEIPGIMVQMTKVGEETGELGNILKTLSKFYQREVVGAVDTLVDLIEPVMIVLLGLGVGFLLASVLLPIYNLTSGIGET